MFSWRNLGRILRRREGICDNFENTEDSSRPGVGRVGVCVRGEEITFE